LALFWPSVNQWAIDRPRRRHSRTINLSTTESSLIREAPNP
jgi:hypothetical protein